MSTSASIGSEATTPGRAPRLQRFTGKQRVKVVEAVSVGDSKVTITINALGVVDRIRRDGGAWIELDERSKVVAVHPFPADDNRARKVLAYPEDCEAPTTKGPAKNRKQRRDGVRAARDASTPLPTIVDFGSDHWSTFGYIEVRIVDHGGHPQREHMRCIDARRPFQAHGHDASDTPTRLKGEATLPNHDDWDCLDDLEREGLLTSLGTAVHPLYALTPRGEKVAAQLRQHKGRGGSFATFTPDVEGAAP